MYNSRKKTGRKAGGQSGHSGKHLSRTEVERKIQEGVYEHRVEEIGTPGGAYLTEYRLNLEMKTVVTGIRIYADADGKFWIPEGMSGEVFYGDTIHGIAGFLEPVQYPERGKPHFTDGCCHRQCRIPGSFRYYPSRFF